MIDELGERMKRFEQVSCSYLIPKVPVIIRVDGKAFHTFTRKFQKPYDDKLAFCMEQAAIALCKEISGAKLAYTASDEISVLVTDLDDIIKTQGYFDYNINKLVSISAAVASVHFNKAHLNSLFEPSEVLFDSRCFNIPSHDVANYFIWRQKDAIRNSISGLGQKHFSPKQLHGLGSQEIINKLKLEKFINWEGMSSAQRQGVSITKIWDDTTQRSKWIVDRETPLFTSYREYVENWLTFYQEGDPNKWFTK